MPTTRRETGLDLEHRASAGRECSFGSDRAAGDENRGDVAGLEGRNEDAALELSQPVEPVEFATNSLQSGDSVAEPRGILEAARLGERAESTL